MSARGSRWVRAIAGWLARRGVHPNLISIASVLCSVMAGACLILGPQLGWGARGFLFVVASCLIEIRLLCNVLDGLVAVEGGRGTRSGEIFNALPDRFSDVLVLVAVGYAIAQNDWGPGLGWAAATLALLTAYVRVLGAAAGAHQDFRGPMAKQQRMQVIAAGCVVAALEPLWGWNGQTLAAALVLVIGGCAATIVRRAWFVIRTLEAE